MNCLTCYGRVDSFERFTCCKEWHVMMIEYTHNYKTMSLRSLWKRYGNTTDSIVKSIRHCIIH
jgi:hypothetical protein